jgi:hypothetical protein
MTETLRTARGGVDLLAATCTRTVPHGEPDVGHPLAHVATAVIGFAVRVDDARRRVTVLP